MLSSAPPSLHHTPPPPPRPLQLPEARSAAALCRPVSPPHREDDKQQQQRRRHGQTPSAPDRDSDQLPPQLPPGKIQLSTTTTTLQQQHQVACNNNNIIMKSRATMSLKQWENGVERTHRDKSGQWGLGKAGDELSVEGGNVAWEEEEDLQRETERQEQLTPRDCGVSGP
ncbi:unnamed protein product [Lampetra planeri]